MINPEIGHFYIYCVSSKIGKNNQTLGVSLQYIPLTQRSELAPTPSLFQLRNSPEQGTRQHTPR